MLYPEVIIPTDHVLIVTDNADGTVTIEANQRFRIGDVDLNTLNFALPDRTFTHLASKIYHFRFSLNGTPINSYAPDKLKFYLVDISNADYNPGANPEQTFHSTEDDILIARIFTSAGNVPTILGVLNTNLKPIAKDKSIVFVVPEDPLAIGIDLVGRMYVDFYGTITEAHATVSGAPSGSDLIFDINKNGSTIWTAKPKLKITPGNTFGVNIDFDVKSVQPGDYFTLDIDQVGSATAGDRAVVKLKIRT
jgi:hypothetical protein